MHTKTENGYKLCNQHINPCTHLHMFSYFTVILILLFRILSLNKDIVCHLFQIFVSLVNGRPGVKNPSSKLLVCTNINYEVILILKQLNDSSFDYFVTFLIVSIFHGYFFYTLLYFSFYMLPNLCIMLRGPG